MQKIDAINWMENWAGRHGVAVRAYRKCRRGESRAGLVLELVPGQLVPADAMAELLAMGKQLTFSEMGPELPTPPGGDPLGSTGGGSDGGGGGGGDDPALTNRAGRVTFEPFKGFEAGQSSLFAAVDQFTLVGRGIAQREAAKVTLSKFLGEGQEGLFGLNTYRQSWRFEGGASVNWSEGRDDWCCIISGETLQLVGEDRHIEFLLAMDSHRDHCTRVDPRVDDYSRELIDLEKVREAMEAGNFVGPRQCDVRTSGKLVHGQLQRDGATLYFGSRHGALIRFYDKALESKGRILSNRCEVEYHKEKAEAAWVKLIEGARQGVKQFTCAVGQLVCGAIDFRERAGHRHVARMERLSWWASIVDKLGSVKIRVEKCLSSLNGACAAMIRQYGKKLARAVVVGEALGHDLILQLGQMIEHLRDGQELQERAPSPLELAFQPVLAFRR